MEFVKNGLGNFFIFFKGGGVLTIFFLFEQLSDNLNQKKIKNERKVVNEYTFLKRGQFKTNPFYLSVHGKSYTKPKKIQKCEISHLGVSSLFYSNGSLPAA